MLHYNVWFTLKNTGDEASGLAIVEEFLSELAARGEASGCTLLQNRGAAGRTKLPRFHAVIVFADQAALDHAMARQAGRGIHRGAHGRVIDVVADFQVEVFTTLSPLPRPTLQYACEI